MSFALIVSKNSKILNEYREKFIEVICRLDKKIIDNGKSIKLILIDKDCKNELDSKFTFIIDKFYSKSVLFSDVTIVDYLFKLYGKSFENHCIDGVFLDDESVLENNFLNCNRLASTYFFYPGIFYQNLEKEFKLDDFKIKFLDLDNGFKKITFIYKGSQYTFVDNKCKSVFDVFYYLFRDFIIANRFKSYQSFCDNFLFTNPQNEKVVIRYKQVLKNEKAIRRIFKDDIKFFVDLLDITFD